MADFSLEAELRANASQFVAELKKGESSIGSLGNVVEKVLGKKGKLVLAIAAATTAAAAASLEIGKAMNSSIAEIAKGTGATGKELDNLSKSVKTSLVNGVGQSAETIGKMIAALNTRFGVTGEELEALVDDFDQFASVTGADVVTSIDDVAKTLNKWGVELERGSDLLDQLTVASQASGASVDSLLSGLQSGQTVLSSFGMNLTESIGFLSSLEKAGVDSATALGGMKIALAKFSTEGKNAETEFKRIANSIRNAKTDTEALSIAVDTFGSKNGAELVKVFQEGSNSAESFTKQLRNAGNALDITDEASRTSMDALDDLKATIQGVFSSAKSDTALKEIIDNIAEAVRNIDADKIAESFDKLKNTIKVVFDEVGGTVQSLWRYISDFFFDLRDYLEKNGIEFSSWEDTLSDILDGFSEFVQRTLQIIMALLEGDFSLAWEYTKLTIMQVIKELLGSFDELSTQFKTIISGIISSVAGIATAIGVATANPILTAVGVAVGASNIAVTAITSNEKVMEKVTAKLENAIIDSQEEIEKKTEESSNRIAKSHTHSAEKREKRNTEYVKKTKEQIKDLEKTTTTAEGSTFKIAEISLEGVLDVVQGIGTASKNAFGTVVAVMSNVASTALKIANVVKSVLTAILNFAKKIVSSVKNILTKLFDFNIDDALDTLLEFEDSVLTFFVETLPNLPNFFAQAINSVVVLLDNVLNILSNTNITELLIGSLEIVLTHLPKIMSNIQTVIMNLITSLYDTFMAYSDRIVDTVGDIILNIVKAIPSVLGMVINVFAEIISEVSEYLIYHAPDILNVLINVVKTVITGIAQFLMNGGWEKMLNALLMLQQVLEEVVSAALPILVSLFEKMLPSVVKVLQKSIKSAAKTFNKLLPSLIKILRMIIEALIDVLLEPEYWDYVNDAIVEIVTGILENIFPLIGKFVGKLFPFILSAVKNIIAGTFEIIGTLIGDIYDAIINMFNKIYDALPSWLQDIIDAIGSVITAIGDVFKEMWDGIVDFIGSFPNAIGNAFNSIVSVITNVCGTIKKVFEWLFDGIEDAFFGIWNGIYRAIQEVIYGINWILSQIENIGSALWGAIGDLFGFATGTESAPRGLALVGEAGPELIRFNGGEQVLNTKNTQKALSEATGGGGNTWNVTFNNLQDTSAYTMIRELKEYNRKLAINNIL